MPLTVSAFYKFVRIDDPAAMRTHLLTVLSAADMRGTVLLAHEGINATISGRTAAMRSFLEDLRQDPRFANLVSKDAATTAHPFKRLKVKVKREILTFGHPEADPTARVGHYVEPQDWNALIADPDVVVIDTRNSFEFDYGSFERAVDPKTRRFTEFPAFVAASLQRDPPPKIAMFCTGGIRCEKASAYLLAHGFDAVYHLKGGILNYLAQVPPDQSLWHGRCFVFDEREAVGAADPVTLAHVELD